MELAPIALFVYNRPWHTRQTLEALAKNDLANQSTLYIYADGPKPNAIDEEKAKINDVRTLLHERKWCKEVVIIEQKQNKGLVNSIIDGVSEVINSHGSAIVLEDDLITGHGFLKFMNEGLNVYSEMQNVWSITGYMFPIEYNTAPRNILLPYVSTWGWGTWKNRWNSFIMNKQSYKDLLESPRLVKIFNLSDYDYLSILMNNTKDSWGIKWYFHIFSYHGLSVFPTKSLLSNIGKDGSGTNYKTKVDSIEPIIYPTVQVEKVEYIDLTIWNKYLDYFTNKTYAKNIFKNVFFKKNKAQVNK